MKEILNYEIWGNVVTDYVYALAVLIVAVIVIQIIKKLFINKINKTEGSGLLGAKFLIRSISRFVIPLFYLGGLYLAMNFLEASEAVTQVLKIIYLLIIVWITIKGARAFIEFFVTKYSQETGKEEDVRRFRPLVGFINVVFYVIGILFILDNLGFEITTIVAGLGIGGIAIALCRTSNSRRSF
ncbi:MAG: hypothetical protein U5K00_08610 [Melioribacteraceae bacterium]|nr:hypothetical protein [Melioribacteraceae bacterium]